MPGGTDAVRVEMGEAEVLDGLFNALYSDDTTRVLPLLIHQLARGSDEVAAPPAWQNVNMADNSTEGLRRSIDWTAPRNRRPTHRSSRSATHWPPATPP